MDTMERIPRISEISTHKSVTSLDQLTVCSEEKAGAEPQITTQRRKVLTHEPEVFATLPTLSRPCLSLLDLSAELPNLCTQASRYASVMCGKIRQCLVIVGPSSLAAPVTSGLFGFAAAYKDANKFGLFSTVFGLGAVVLLHVSSSMVTGYHCHLQDANKKPADDKRLPNRNQIEELGIRAYVGGCVAFVFLLLVSPARVEHLALLFFGGLSSGFFFPGGTETMDALCRDLVTAGVVGPVTSLFCYVAACGRFSYFPIVRGFPLTLSILLTVLTSDGLKESSERSANRRGISASSASRKWAYFLSVLLLYVPLIWALVLAFTRSCFYFIILSIIRLAKFVEQNMRAALLENRYSKATMSDLTHRTAQLNAAFSLLFLICYVME
ncbi:hypothetical protein RvY_14682 [Ramazzottius varieornatus]|uniref:UbiA prenyltransferase domain-containing protein 1 n=1 Tax=Ramazzottius varieornatus TaxID=947166 RepID=A0A1D1VX82_RAMVA|nr:hypothetical protein RvY_14682 [Ramazzottius varieornatus]